MLGQFTNERQAQVMARQLDVAAIPGEPLDLLGEEPCVIRVRKTPTFWQVESWPVSKLQEADVAFP